MSLDATAGARPADAGPASAARRYDPLTRALAALLLAYKRWLSPLLPRSCLYTPTCSEYARLALIERGPWVGGAKAVWRLLRCQPLSAGGLDLP